MENISGYLEPGKVINSDHPDVIRYTENILAGKHMDDREKAVRLYKHVRDDIRYDPYMPFYKPEHYLSSNIIKEKRGFCIPKAGLLCAVARASGIPARIGFATVRNHLSTKQLREYLGSDVVVFHGYTEIWLNKKWVKATPAFNAELCMLHKVPPLEFDGINDSIFHEYNSDKERFMEYIAFHGEFHDVPVELILKSWRDAYGEERVNNWIKIIENRSENMDFTREEII